MPAADMLADAELHRPQPRPQIMAMPWPLPTFTVDMVRALPDDGNRYELVGGVLLVTPAPAPLHQIVLARLLTSIAVYLEHEGVARAASPGEIEIQPSLHLEPDLLVFPASYPIRSTWTEIAEWWLAVEVLSPQSRIYDRDYKVDAYLAAGVDEVWIVDPKGLVVEVSAQDGGRFTPHRDELTWHPRGMAVPLSLDLSRIFAEIS
ncbi:MAG TPA: Uma2 family endonuclease [Gemmatimonadales bacterium]|nr:Uma2 family endonuclease [Gemmatimonadales bacterium]